MVALPEDTVNEMRKAPEGAFNSPAAVVDDGRLSHRQKMVILESWARTCREQAAAAAEGNDDGQRAVSRRVSEIETALEALATLSGRD